VRFQRVSRDADDLAVGVPELAIGVAEIRPLLRAAGRVVLGVEVQNQLVAALAGEAEGAAAGGGKAEVLDRLAYGFQSF